MSPIRVSVIIATFEQPNALRFALLGYRRQSWTDFELVVADDGSDEETRRVIDELKRDSPYPIKHVWQENHGFRRSKICNQAVLESTGSLLVLTDGDCIPHQDFLRLHVEHLPHDGFSVGSYARLSAEASRLLTPSAIARGEYEQFLTPRQKRSDRWEHWINQFHRLFPKKGRPKVRGCNIGVARSAFYEINGYDENFDGFGKEDSDLRDRLRLARKPYVSLWSRAYVFHIDDAIDPKVRARRIPRDKKKAEEYYYRNNVTARCENGMVKGSQSPVSSSGA